jgi:hypothetical protein
MRNLWDRFWYGGSYVTAWQLARRLKRGERFSLMVSE